MDTANAIGKRRSIRKFKQIPLDGSSIRSILEAARLAPCAANLQRLRYIVVHEDEKLLNDIFNLTKWAGYVQPRRDPVPGESAPTAFIAVTAPQDPPPIIHADAGAAIQSMMLRALAFDIGCCWIGAYDHEACDELLGLTDGERQSIYLVALGIADENPVEEDISSPNDGIEYYLDDDDRLHVPKLTVDALTEWR